MIRSTQVGAAPGGAGSADENGRRRRIRAVADPNRADPAAVVDSASPPADGHPRIVVVDADPQVARTIGAVLRPSGATIVGTAERAADAVTLIDRLRPDLVMLEAGPGGDGYRVAADLHRRALAPVVLLLHGDADPAADPIAESGAVGCLSTPLRSDALPPVVEMALARAASLTALREQVADITGRLRDREVLERAKGLLMVHRGLSEPQAFRWLQRTAMDRRTPMTTVAAAVVDRFASAAGPDVRSAPGSDGRRAAVPAPVLPPGHRLRDEPVRRTAVGQ